MSNWQDLGGGIVLADRSAAARILLSDIATIKRDIDGAPDEETEEAYWETLHKWKCKLARVLGARPPE